jgi:DNA-binding SARP family transcriptional activator/WD40 repeat protein
MSPTPYALRVRFEVLGPLKVTDGGAELPLGGPQQRLVLAMLVAGDGAAVSTDRLVDALWGDDPPATARKTIQGYIHHLRASIGAPLTTERAGYALVTDGNTDVAEFAALHRRAAQAEPGEAADLLRRALALWRGAAYADVSDASVLMAETARLDNLRLVAVGDRIEVDLELGRHDELIGELEGLTLEHPFQERFRAQHMTALYRAGRTTEALRAFERHRRFLADESGLEPSAELRRLEERILAQDEALLGAAAVDGAGDPAAIRGYELREKVASDAVGETYRAYQPSVGRLVTVRVIGPPVANDPTFISTFLPDTQRVAEIDHPNISYVFDTWREPGRAFQVSRWLGGGNLADADLATGQALRVLSDVGDALAHAHRQGVVHGAVDTSSVRLDDHGHAYLSGFRVGTRSDDDSVSGDIEDFAALAHRVLVGRPPRTINGARVADTGGTAAASLEPVFEKAFSDDGFDRVEDFLRALRRAAGTDVVATPAEAARLAETRNPYKGLKAFEESDADDFYGRDQLIDTLVGAVDRRRLVAVVGPSGSGKSSLVKAGLISRLRAGGEPPLITEMYPGAFPFEELEGALLGIGVNRTSLIEDLLSDDRGLLRVLKQILPPGDKELVVVIDQFEELFSVVADESTRRLFMDSLVNAISEPRSRLRVVITLRADFFDRPLQYPHFGEVLEAGLVPVTVPGGDDLARATVAPARSEGVEFEDGLVAQIVQDVSGQPGSLPLLQYALTELFDSRHSNTLSLAAYQRSGGVRAALGRRAEQIYEGLKPAEQTAIREAFLRMVTVDEHADDLRRRVRRSDLAGIGNQKDLDGALQAYAAARLITFDSDPLTRGPTVEVAHEALLREWDRLQGWIDGHRHDLVVRRRLDAALEEWKQSGRDDGYLPTGPRLAQFEEWATETDLALTESERRFLQAGADSEADRNAWAVRRRRRVMAGFGVAAVIASLLAIVALRNASEAGSNARLAKSRELTASAINAMETDPELSILLSLEAIRLAPDADTRRVESRTALGDALRSFRLLERHPVDMEVYAAAPSPDMTGIALTDKGTIEFYELDGWTQRWSIEWSDLPFADDGRPEGCFDYLSFLPSGDHLIAKVLDEASSNCRDRPSDITNSAAMVVIDAGTGVVDRVIPQGPCPGGVMGPVSPDGSLVPHMTCDGAESPDAEWRIDLLDTATFEAVGTLELVGLQSPNGLTSWSDDGSRLLFTGWSGEGFRLYNVETEESIAQGRMIGQGGRGIQNHTLSPDGTRTAAADVDTDEVVVLEAETGELIHQLTGLEGYAQSIVWEEDGERIIAGGVGGNTAVWESSTGDLVEILPNTGPVGAPPGLLSFDQDSDTLVHVGSREVSIWDLSTEVEAVSVTDSEPVGLLGIYAVRARDDLGVLFGDPGPFMHAFDPHTGEIGAASLRVEWTRWPAVLPDGRGVVAFSSDPRHDGSPLVVWDPASGNVEPLVGCEALVAALDITQPDPCGTGVWDILPRHGVLMTADGSQLVVTSWDGHSVFIDPATLEFTGDRTMPEGFRTLLAIGPDWMLGSDTELGAEVAAQQLTLVDRETGDVRATLSAPRLITVASDSTGRLLAVYDRPGGVTVLDTRTGEGVTHAAGSGSVEGLAFSPDDELLMTSTTDGFVRVWDLETGAEIERVSLNGGYGAGVWIDERTIGIGDVTTGEWIRLSLDSDLVDRARSRLTRTFTPSECVTYRIDPCPTLEEMMGD